MEKKWVRVGEVIKESNFYYLEAPNLTEILIANRQKQTKTHFP